MSTIFIVIPILTLLMFDLGLELRPADFKLIARQPRPVLAGLIGQIILLPALAWAVAAVADLQPVFFIGVMLIACSPGGSSSNVFSMLAKGDVALSVTLTACSSVITLFTIPLIMAFTTQWVGTGTDIHLPVGNLLVQNIILMAVPIAIFPSLGITMTVLILSAMAAGLLIAWLMRLKQRERRTIVIEVGMQNAAQAITVACSPLVFNNEQMAIPAIIYALMMNVILLTYVAVVKRK